MIMSTRSAGEVDLVDGRKGADVLKQSRILGSKMAPRKAFSSRSEISRV